MLTVIQQRLARMFTWQLTDALLGSLGSISEYGGSSGAKLGEPGDWMEYNRTRIVIGPCGILRRPNEARVVVTWAAIAKHGATLSDDLRDRLRANRAEGQSAALSANKYWRYSVSMDPVARWAMDAWVAGHCQRLRRIREEAAALHVEAFPLTVADVHPAHDHHEVRITDSGRVRCITCHLYAEEDPAAVEAEFRARYGITEHEPTDLLELLEAMS